MFSAKLREGHPAFLWVHYEHQSSVDPVMSWRMVEVAIELLKRWRAHHPEARRFPPILPVVFYHGTTPWNAPTSFLDLYEMSDEARADLADYLLSMRYVLDDLRTTDDEDIDARPLEPLPRLGLVVMKYATAEELGEHLAAHHEGQRALLLRQLERRFGPLPLPITERVTKAGVEDITAWGERILDANSLDDVFAP